MPPSPICSSSLYGPIDRARALGVSGSSMVTVDRRAGGLRGSCPPRSWAGSSASTCCRSSRRRRRRPASRIGGPLLGRQLPRRRRRCSLRSGSAASFIAVASLTIPCDSEIARNSGERFSSILRRRSSGDSSPQPALRAARPGHKSNALGRCRRRYPAARRPPRRSAGKVAQLTSSALRASSLGQPRQGPRRGQQIERVRVGCSAGRAVRPDRPLASSPPCFSARLRRACIDQNPPHRLGRGGEEVAAGVEGRSRGSVVGSQRSRFEFGWLTDPDSRPLTPPTSRKYASCTSAVACSVCPGFS